MAIMTSLLLVACTTQRSTPVVVTPTQHSKREVCPITLQDGVDEKEATIIAERYLQKFGGTCKIGRIYDDDSDWKIEVFSGEALQVDDPVRVSKRTGWVYWPGHGTPTIHDPRELWEQT